MNTPIGKSELTTNAETIKESLSDLIPGSKTFRDKATEVSRMFKTLKLPREDRGVLWQQFDGLYKEHKAKQQEFRDEQKKNAGHIEQKIGQIEEFNDLFTDYSNADQWKKIREVSQLFKTIKLSREDRERLWGEFNRKCESVRTKEFKEKENKETLSVYYRNQIVRALSQSRSLSPESIHTTSNCITAISAIFTMGTSLFFGTGPTFDDDFREIMRGISEAIKESSKTLSEHKSEMTHEHKQECFNAIKEAREYLDEQWTEFKKRKAEEFEGRQAHRAEKQAKHESWKERTLANVELNREKHEKAVNDLARMEDHLSGLRDKLYDARPGNYFDRVSVWISESEEQIESKKVWIEKLEQWIEEGEEKLRG